LIEKAITGNLQAIWIRYQGGSTPGEVRAIQPRRWASQPFSFQAISLRPGDSNQEKKYMTMRITEAKESVFE